MTKRRGSALVIALLLIAVIGGLAFGIGRLVFLETATATAYENGSVAYFAAESGIEEGFLRYRYDRNAEIPQGNPSLSLLWTLGQDKVYRTNINQGQTWYNTNRVGWPSTDALDKDYGIGQPWTNVPREQIYDLRMGYVGTNGKPWYGQSVIADQANYVTSDSATLIAKDNTKKIDLSPMNLSDSNNSLTLFGKFSGSETENCKALTEVTLTVTYAGSNKVDQFKDFYVRNASACGPILGVDGAKLSQYDSYDLTNKSFKVDNIERKILAKAGSPVPVSGDKISLTIKPLYYNLTIGLAAKNCQDSTCATGFSFTHLTAVPGPFTTITSTGYYGGASRKISANIDRESGTLYDLYDYVLFKGN